MATSSSTQSPLLVPRGALEGKPPIPISRPVWIVGSRKGCHLHLQSEHVSQAHAVIINTGRGLFIKDLASRTHTYVNRVPVKEVQLKDGDKLQIGPFKFYFRDPTANPGDKPPVAPPAVLKVVGEPIPVPLDDRVTLIGRRPTADIHLTEDSVSTTHALIFDLDGEHYVRDLGSRTGTFLNGEKVRQAPLSPGDKLRIGETEMTFDTVVGEPIEEEQEQDELAGSRLALTLDEPAAPAEAAEPVAPAAEAPSEPAPLAEADLDDVLGLTPDQPAAASADEPLPLELAPEPPAAQEPPAEAEVSANATPVVEPEPPAEEPVAESPAVEQPAPEPSAETPTRARRGWKLWGTRQPAATPSPVEPPRAEAPAPPPAVEEPTLSEPLELSEVPESAPPVVDLTSADEPASPPVVDLSDEAPPDEAPADEPPAVEQVDELADAPEPDTTPADEALLPLEPENPDATDTAYAVDVAPGSSESASQEQESARDEVTAGDLELSAVEETPAIDLESSAEQEQEQQSAVATETEPSADDVFGDVDVESLALDALNEPQEEPAQTEEVSATIDQQAAADDRADSSTLSSDAEAETIEPVAEEPPAAVTEPEPPADLVEPEAPTAPVEDPSAINELPSPEDEKALEDQPLTMADEGSPEPPPEPPKPASAGRKDDDDLPPPLTTPVKLKPSTRRRKRGGGDDGQPRRGPMRGPGGKFISAAEAARLAAQQSAEAEGLSGVEAPEQTVTTDAGSEVLESTEPTPESALSLEPVTPAVADEIPLPTEEPVPSDSVFGRAVEEMGGTHAGELVEPSAEPVPADDAAKPLSPLEQIAADATHFVEADVPSHVTVADEVEHPEPAAEIIEHEEVGQVEPPPPLELPTAEEPAPLEPIAEPAEPTLELPAEPEAGVPAVEPIEEVEAPLELPAVAEEPVTLHLGEDPEQSELQLDTPETEDVAAPEQEATIESPPPLELPPVDEAPIELPPIAEVETVTPEPLQLDDSATLAGEVSVAEPSATDSETAEPVQVEPTGPVAESPVTEEPPAAPPQVSPGPGGLGAYGILRDADTFLGGMPLSLPPLAPPPPTFGKVGLSFGDQPSSASPHQAPPPPPLIIGHDDDEADDTAADEAPEAATDETPSAEPPADYTDTGEPIQQPEEGSTDAPVPPPQGATADAPKLVIPPRPRRNRLADYEKRFAKVDEDAAIEALMREQQKPLPEQPAASGFDGLTLGPAVRQTDVFSDAPGDPLAGVPAPGAHDPFLADKQASIDLAARSVDAGRVPPGLTAASAGNGADPFAPPVAPRADLPGEQIDRNDKAPPRMPSRPTPAPAFDAGPQRGGRKIPIRVLLAAMVVCMIGAGVAGFMLTPIYTTLQARATFANLKDRSPFEQHKFRTEQQTVLTSEEVRNQAKALLASEHPGLGAGLLADPLAFDAIARELEWPSGTNEMRLKVRSVDPEGDKHRLAVLLRAIYSENKHLIDVARQRAAEFEQAQAELEQLNSQMKDLQIRIRQEQDKASDAPGGSMIAAVEQEAASLRQLWDEANEKVTKLKFELERLAPGGVMPQVEAGNDPALDNIAGGDPEKDPVVVATREQLKALQEEIARLKAVNDEDAAEKARVALDQAIETFQQELAKLQDGKGPEWNDFLAKAKKLQGMAELMTGAIIQSQRDEQNKLAELKRKLEQELEERREKRFAASKELQDLIDQNRLARRQYNAASAEGLVAEAARHQAWEQETSAQIDALKAELSKDPEKEGEIAKVQKLIEDGKASIATDRRALDARMVDAFKEFVASGQQLYKKLDEPNRAAAQGLADRAGEMVNANQLYGKLVNSIKAGDTEELQKKEADAQQLAAAIERRIAQVKDAERKNKSDLEKQAAIQQIEKARADLAAAEAAQKEAGDKWVAKQQELADLRAKAALAKAADDKLQENLKAREALQAKISQKVAELDEKRKTGVASVIPDEPAPDAVTETDHRDDRWMYALIASGGVCALFLVLIWLGGYHQNPTPGGPRPVIESAAAPTTERAAGDEETVTV